MTGESSRTYASPPRWPAIVALIAAVLGLAFAWSSSADYAHHLDRQIHDIHCSFVPGLGGEQTPDNPCRVAMYSPYAAIFRDRYWGGVPIALFALGAFSFFVAFAGYLVLGASKAPRRAWQFLAGAGALPLVASIVMATITVMRLGHFCKTCVGIYAASIALAIGGIAGYYGDKSAAQRGGPKIVTRPADVSVPPTIVDDEAGPRRLGGFLLIPAWLLALGVFAATPALLYVSALPSYGTYIASCGKLEKPVEPNNALIHLPSKSAVQPVTMFVDPLCPTCKAFHQRLEAEGFLDQLDITLVLFPLDNECNWMLDRAVHPGSCAVSKAVICGDHRAMQVLEWAYQNQDEILETAKQKAGTNAVRAMISARWQGFDACIDSKETALRLNRMLRHIVNNHLPVSTPQMYLGDTKLCDEDSDMGLSFTMHKLAPGLKKAEVL